MQTNSLYIHFPWCHRKCPYCDFNSHQLQNLDSELENRYIDNLILDLKYTLEKFNPNKKISSIYCGGGTPSLFSASSIEKLFNQVNKLLILDHDIEITLELNPGTIETSSQITDYLHAGINRISVGGQSFDNNKLLALGRIHDSNNLHAVLNTLNQAQCNYNLDLMFGLPNQSDEQAMLDLQTAIAYNPPHLSWYQLTLEPNTLFYSQPPKNLPDHDRLYNISQNGQELLARSGYKQYEVSAYASGLDKMSKHNLNYWQFGDYIGIGAGAHGKITDGQDSRPLQITRTVKNKHPKNYLEQTNNYIQSEKIILGSELPFEFMLNTLRLTEGFDLDLFTKTTNLDISTIRDRLNSAVQQNFITVNNNKLVPTQHGKLFLDNLTSIFL